MAKPTSSQEPHVLIIGAGITGLILAQALEKIPGISYSIFEKASSLNVRSNEWTMAIHWSLERLETLLPPNVYAEMEQASCNPSVPIDAGGNYPIIHAETGNLLAGVPYSRGLRVPRSKMRSLCAKGLQVEYDKRLVDVAFDPQGGVTATFDDGTSAQGTMIVGADGARSRIREIAVKSPEKAAVTAFPIWHMNLTVCYGDAAKARQVRAEFPTSYLALSQRSFHAFQSISSMPDGAEHPESWIFHLAMAWRGEAARHELSHAERLAMIKEKAAGLGEPARSSFMWIPDDTQVHKADISYWITEPWDNRQGLITLVGDAAHPMPPYRGQGLNHCIADIYNLVAQIKQATHGEKSWASAISDYEQEMVVRGSEEVKCSIENGIMLHDWERVKQSPVFNAGFRPMKGHDDYETNARHDENQKKAEAFRASQLKT